MNRPFIHLFTTPIGYYCYDVNTGQVIEIDSDVYSCLKERSDRSMNKITEQKINRMVDDGLLKSNKVLNVKHPYTELLPFAINTKIHVLILQVTQNCNLRCDYCVYSGGYTTRTHQNKRMSLDTAKLAIDFLKEHSGEKEKLTICFYGGEPLLEFDLIKSCVEYSESIMPDKKIEYAITTNGTLLSEKYIDWMVEKNFIITVSLDGPKEVHDRSRLFADTKTGSFDTIMNNLSFLKSKYPAFYKTNVHFNTVLSTEYSFSCTDSYFKESDLFYDAPITLSGISGSYKKTPVPVLDEYVCEEQFELFKLMLFLLGRLKSNSSSPLLNEYIRHIAYINKKMEQNVRNALPETWHRGGPCVPGITRLFVTVDGELLPCEKVCETSEACKIGSLKDGLDIDKISKLLNIEALTHDTCSNCWAYAECTTCARKYDDNECHNIQNILDNCESVRVQVEETFKDYAVLKKLGYDFSKGDHIQNLQNVIRRPILTPVVFLANMFVGMDNYTRTCAQYLKAQIEDLGYSVALIDGRDFVHRDCSVLGMMNEIHNEIGLVEINENPDLLIVIIPGNCVEISKKLCGDGGTYFHLYSQAVSPDFVILNAPFSGQLLYEYEAICRCVNSMGIPFDSLNVIPYYFDVELSEEEEGFDYLSLSSEFVASKITNLKNAYCVYDHNDSKKLATYIIDFLSALDSSDTNSRNTKGVDSSYEVLDIRGSLVKLFTKMGFGKCTEDTYQSEPFFGSKLRMRSRDLLVAFFAIEEMYGISINEEDIDISVFRSFSSLANYLSGLDVKSCIPEETIILNALIDNFVK